MRATSWQEEVLRATPTDLNAGLSNGAQRNPGATAEASTVFRRALRNARARRVRARDTTSWRSTCAPPTHQLRRVRQPRGQALRRAVLSIGEGVPRQPRREWRCTSTPTTSLSRTGGSSRDMGPQGQLLRRTSTPTSNRSSCRRPRDDRHPPGWNLPRESGVRQDRASRGCSHGRHGRCRGRLRSRERQAIAQVAIARRRADRLAVPQHGRRQARGARRGRLLLSGGRQSRPGDRDACSSSAGCRRRPTPKQPPASTSTACSRGAGAKQAAGAREHHARRTAGVRREPGGIGKGPSHLARPMAGVLPERLQAVSPEGHGAGQTEEGRRFRRGVGEPSPRW